MRWTLPCAWTEAELHLCRALNYVPFSSVPEFLAWLTPEQKAEKETHRLANSRIGAALEDLEAIMKRE